MSLGIADHQSKILGTPWQWMEHPAWLNGGRSIAVAARGKYSEFTKMWEFLADGKTTPITNDTQLYTDLDAPAELSEVIAIQIQRSSTLGMLDLSDPHRYKYKEISELGYYFSWVAWTPSSKIISSQDAGGGPEFFEIDPKQVDRMRQLTFDGFAKADAAVSPDGQTLVYAAAAEGTRHLWRRRVDGTDQPVRLTSAKAEEHHPAITPNGQWVIYTSTEGGFQALWKAPIAGGTPVQLTHRPARKAALSPDGKFIACEYADDLEKGWAVAVLNSETLKPLWSFPHLPASDDALPVRWSPDGKSLLYNDSSPHQLTHFSSERIFAFAPSPDGRSLACLRGLQSSDVVMAQAAESSAKGEIQ
jgi:WD40 repeat protein